MDNTLENIRTNIKLLRKNFGLTQQQLAEKIVMSTSHLADIEIGRTKPSIDALIKIAGAFNIETYLLLAKPDTGNKELLDNFTELLFHKFKSDAEELKKQF